MPQSQSDLCLSISRFSRRSLLQCCAAEIFSSNLPNTVFAAEEQPSSMKKTAPMVQPEVTLMPHQPTLRKPNEGHTISVVGDVYRFLATGEETDGKYAMWEATVPSKGGPPPHIHSREEESFYILEGKITFTIGEEKIVATQGMFANMPVGSLHSFKNTSDKMARMIISVAPAGLEKMFFEFGVPLEEGSTEALPPTKEEIDKLLKIAPKYGIQIKVPGH